MLMLRKAEVSIEFIVLVGLMLLIFTFMVMVIGLKNQDITETMIYSDAQRIADTIASEINTASRIEGYYREFDIPEKIANVEDYHVDINKDFRIVQVKWGSNENKVSTIVTENVTGIPEPGTNMIRNNEGEIEITNS